MLKEYCVAKFNKKKIAIPYQLFIFNVTVTELCHPDSGLCQDAPLLHALAQSYVELTNIRQKTNGAQSFLGKKIVNDF